ncbi:hypothetical protein OX283_006140 [Flavobacterium sp. SUN052]|uniref:hypothetical protein n=1 Tax=Flavobacterium sp. SUN052 TaxID=3002441 RepID=UPI00237DC078|nr:hypothetical protein [Flavobacterium sp. SUN052]MEC4004227.1 hypothetical protein [Flavobacterium sp. SUN052]
MKKLILLVILFSASLFFHSCSDIDDTAAEPKLIIKFKFDPNQVRLNNLGQVSYVPFGHAAQSPIFKAISSHFIEFAPNENTQLGDGQIVYHGAETDLGGANAIDFSQAKIVAEGEAFLEIPLKSLAIGSYEWIRASISYQNYQIKIRKPSSSIEYDGTLSSFVGFNTYIGTHAIGNTFFQVDGNKPQGYWAFALNDFPYSSSGQAPAGATTVPNPIAATSPIPLNSCVVTGKFNTPLVISGIEKKDVVITLSLSTNNSFEWIDSNNNGKYDPSQGENVVDMGLRGLIPSYTK